MTAKPLSLFYYYYHKVMDNFGLEVLFFVCFVAFGKLYHEQTELPIGFNPFMMSYLILCGLSLMGFVVLAVMDIIIYLHWRRIRPFLIRLV